MAVNQGIQSEEDFLALQAKVADKREEYDTETAEIDGLSVIPSYMLASSAHAIATGDLSALASPINPTGGTIGMTAGAIAGGRAGFMLGGLPGAIGGAIIGGAVGYDWRYAADAAISGTSQLVNGAINLITFGQQPETINTDSLIASLDDDLSQYYQFNKESVDAGGFLVSSLLPGIGGVKALNWGSMALDKVLTGVGGRGLTAATGLLPSMRATYLAQAEANLVRNGMSYSMLDASVMKGIATGAAQQALEFAAFEMGVQAVMAPSPMLAAQDYEDIRSNVLDAAILGGGIGGVLGGLSTSYRLLKRLHINDAAVRPAEFQEGVKPGTTFDDHYVFNMMTAEDIVTKGTGFDAVQLRTINSVNTKNRQLVQDLPSSEPAIANMFHQQATALGAKVPGYVMGVEDLAPIMKITEKEEQIAAIQSKVDAGAVLMPEESAMLSQFSIKYVTFWGEGAGNISTKIGDINNNLYQVWDLLNPGRSINITKYGANTGLDGISHTIDLAKPFSYMNELTNVKDVSKLNLRSLWAIHTDAALPTGTTIHIHDPALLRKAIKDMKANPEAAYNIYMPDGYSVLIQDVGDMEAILLKSVSEIATAKIGAPLQIPSTEYMLHEEAIASALDVRLDALRNIKRSINMGPDLNALESFRDEYINTIGAKIELEPMTRKDTLLLQPRRAKLILNSRKLTSEDIHSIPLLTRMKQEQKLLDQQANIAVAHAIGAEDYALLPEGAAADVVNTTRDVGAAGIITPADYALGSGGAFWQRVGALTSRLMIKGTNKVISLLDAPLAKLVTNDAAAAHFGTIMNDLQATGEVYYHVPGRGLVRRELLAYEEAIASGKMATYPPPKDINAKDIITIKPEYADIIDPIIDAHVSLNNSRVTKFDLLRRVTGRSYDADPKAVYFPPPYLEKYPHIAIVTDKTLAGMHGSASRLLYAASEKELMELIATIPEQFKPGVVVKPKAMTKEETKRWFEAIGRYKDQDFMSERYFNAAFQRSGVAARYYPQSDAKVIIKDLRDWHTNMERKLVRESISTKYYKEFYELRALGEKAMQAGTSKFGTESMADIAIAEAKNPYASHIRTALDLSVDEHLPLHTFQDAADRAVSVIWDGITNLFRGSKTVADLDVVAKEMKAAGIQPIIPDVYTLALTNHSLPRGALETFSRRASAVLTSVMLKPSVLNAMLNYIGTTVLLAPEVEHILSMMKSGNKEIVGALTESAFVKIPGGERTYFNTAKLIARNVKRAGQREWIDWGTAKGFNVRTSLEMSLLEDTLALKGNETGLDLESILQRVYSSGMKLADKLEVASGNSLAESKTRLTTALVMEELTAPLVKNGQMSQQLADVYIQNLVNRVNGIYQTSQRPLLFRGPIGQSMGLFQTYFVTMMNNILRHAREGNTRSLALMLAAQGSIHGLSTLPGFQQINTNIVGSFAGNKDHKDIFSLAYSTLDKDTADWMMYGALSNTLGLLHPALKINMYTRGDANPRNVSLIPLSPLDYPIVATSAKFFNNLMDTMDRATTAGVPLSQTILTGLEHNSVSRELSGIAQVLQGAFNAEGKSYSTSAHGDLVAANDLFSLMNVGRLLGAKNLDVAKALDESYRNTVYHARDIDMITRLGSGIKDKIRSGDEVTYEDILTFQHEYLKRGGNVENFNKYWMELNKDATVAQANQLTRHLKKPEAQEMLRLLGGRKEEIDMSGVAIQ